VQRSLAASFKYGSLYEAQVTYRVESPARYPEFLQTALDLIGNKRVPQTRNFGKLDMLALLESGIPLELSKDKQLFVGIVQPGSPLTGQSLEFISNTVLKGTWKVMAILRGDETALPQGKTELIEGDRLLIVCSPEVPDQLAKYLVFGTSQVPL